MMISLQKIKRLVKEEDAKRVSDMAAKRLNKILEKRAREIIRKAIRNADFSGRSTIRVEDISE